MMPMNRKDQAAFDNAMRKLVKHGTPNQPADDERERLREACILLIDTCEALAGQQAMPDDSWRKAVEEAIAALGTREEGE